jgi:hypothetical protein
MDRDLIEQHSGLAASKVQALEHDFFVNHTEPHVDVEVDDVRLGPSPSPRAGRALVKEPWLTLGPFSVGRTYTVNAARLVAALQPPVGL